MSSVSTQHPRISCAVDHPVIISLGSRGSSPLSLSYIAWKCACARDAVNALHLAPTFFYRTFTEMASPRRILPTRGLSHLHIVLSVPGTPEAKTQQPSPSGPSRPRGWWLRWLTPMYSSTSTVSSDGLPVLRSTQLFTTRGFRFTRTAVVDRRSSPVILGSA